jgi:anaerobic sulfite reductase subunit B
MSAPAEFRAIARASPMTPILYRVVGSVRETSATVTLTLDPIEEQIPPVSPGQFNMLWTWGAGEVPISVSAVLTDGRLVHTIREVGDVSHALCGKQVGDVVGVRGPFGRGWGLGAARGQDLIIVAGGIGLAPVRPLLNAIRADREAFGEVSLVVGARTSAELLFRSELDEWWQDRGADSPRVNVRTIVDRSSTDWRGSVGIVTNELTVAFRQTASRSPLSATCNARLNSADIVNSPASSCVPTARYSPGTWQSR